jgi:predicted alpha/beta superfamily hydrolase
MLQSSFLLAQMSKLSSGKIERVEKFPSDYVDPRNVDVWLPDNYDISKKYAVLYMHDGQMLFDSTTTWNKQEWQVDETISKLMREGKIKDCILVAVWNTEKRHREYFPQKAFEYLSEADRKNIIQTSGNTGINLNEKILSDNYLKFLVKELKPFIDSKYSTLSDKENTVIAGSSMGGLISMYAMCEYHEIFGAAACLSTHWPGIFLMENNPIPATFYRYLNENLPPKTAQNRIYFDYGTVNLDSHYEPLQNVVDNIMQEKGYDEKNWITKKFEGADHNEKSWSKRLHIPITFLLGK